MPDFVMHTSTAILDVTICNRMVSSAILDKTFTIRFSKSVKIFLSILRILGLRSTVVVQRRRVLLTYWTLLKPIWQKIKSIIKQRK